MFKHSKNEGIDDVKHLPGVLKGRDRQDTQESRKSRFYSQIRHFPHPLLTNSGETPFLHSGNLPASNATHLDVFWRHSEPVSSIPGPRHGGTMFLSSRTPLHRNRRKLTRFHAFLTRCYLGLVPCTSQLQSWSILRCFGSISSQIRLFRAQDPCPTNWMMDHRPPPL